VTRRQLRQLGDIAAQQLGRRLSFWLFLVIDIRKLLAVALLHDERAANIFNEPGRREAVFGGIRFTTVIALADLLAWSQWE
jgi:hypothetical protein